MRRKQKTKYIIINNMSQERIFYPLDNYHDGKTFYFYTLDDCIISQLTKTNKIWEKYLHDVFEHFVNKDSVVIECGCHIGIHAVKLASLCAKFYGFEPMPKTNELLNRNLKLNNIENATIFKKGVSNKEGKTKYSWIENKNEGGAGLDDNPMGTPEWAKESIEKIEVELMTIDSLNLSKLDFMKIDVEGYEPLVIEGAMETIKRHRPVIAMEVWQNHSGGVNIEYTQKLFKGLLDIGYRVVHINGPDFIFLPN